MTTRSDTHDDRRLLDDLRTAFAAADPALDTRLESALAERADADHVLDIAYRTFDSPFGALLLAATTEGIVRIAFELEGFDSVLERLAADVSPRILRAPRRLDRAADQLDEYFAGRRRAFDLALDLQLAHGFRRLVLDHLRAVPYGATETYAALALAAGNAKAVRAVGSACSHNPVPFVVPCHRIVRSDGTIGNYLGGTATKQALLSLERDDR